MKFRHNAKRVFTAALVAWMSGVIVLFCCSMPSAHAANEEIESCPLARKGDCSKTSGNNSEQSFGQEPRSFDCYAFPAKVFDKARKLESTPQSPIVAKVAEIPAPRFSLIEQTFITPKFIQSFVRNRGGTYLENRVFRI